MLHNDWKAKHPDKIIFRVMKHDQWIVLAIDQKYADYRPEKLPLYTLGELDGYTVYLERPYRAEKTFIARPDFGYGMRKKR